MTPVTVPGILLEIVRNPYEYLIRRWNWKSALFSPLIRALIFLFANLAAGWKAALAAALVELIYRGPTAGIYGALTQAFRKATPTWAAGLTVMVIMPTLSHSLEALIHCLHGTPKLAASITSSVCYTALTTLFNLYAMQRGLLVTGEGQRSVASDLRQMPRTIVMFVAAGPIAIFHAVRLPFIARVTKTAGIDQDFA